MKMVRSQKYLDRKFDALHMEHFGLYVMHYVGEGICKIGVTSNLPDRHAALAVGYWGDIEVTSFWFPYLRNPMEKSGFNTESVMKASSYALETQCHAKLKDLGVHLKGEFFEMFPDDARLAVSKIADQGGFKLASPHDIMSLDALTLVKGEDISAYGYMQNTAAQVADFMAYQNQAKSLAEK